MTDADREKRVEAAASALDDHPGVDWMPREECVAIAEVLLKAADEAVPVVDDAEYQQLLRDHGEAEIDAQFAHERAERAKAAVRDFAKALREALDLADEGWAYASDYFVEKWNVEERQTALRAVFERHPGWESDE